MSYASLREVKWEHRVQRLGFVCFVGIAVAAALGFLGDRARIVASTSAIYLLLLLIFRIAGRRQLSETSTFDLVLLLIIGETTQQAMVGNDDDSVLSAAIAILSLVSLDMGITYLRKASPAFDHLLEGRSVLLIHEGKIRQAALDAHSLDMEDLKEAARLSHGLNDMEDVRQATLERDGKISIVPWRGKKE
jgi:uncharacterized membrane protein YcaP (DUF421 family)